MQARSLQDNALVEQYVHIVNDSLGRHEDQTPWKQILTATKAMGMDNVEAGIAIYTDDPDKPSDHFVLGWREGRLKALNHGKDGEDRTYWAMPRDHLVDVVDDPKSYLKDPTKFNLDWMTRRLGIKMSEGRMPVG